MYLFFAPGLGRGQISNGRRDRPSNPAE